MRHLKWSDLGLDHSHHDADLQGFASVLVPGPEKTADLVAEEGPVGQFLGHCLALQTGVQPAAGALHGNVPSPSQFQEIRSGPVAPSFEGLGKFSASRRNRGAYPSCEISRRLAWHRGIRRCPPARAERSRPPRCLRGRWQARVRMHRTRPTAPVASGPDATLLPKAAPGRRETAVPTRRAQPELASSRSPTAGIP